MLTLKGQSQNLTSGQGHVSRQVGRIAYQSMRLCERDTLGPFIVFYISSIKGLGQKRM